MSSKRIAVWIERATHKALAKHARTKGVGIAEAADALLRTGLGRAEALARAKTKGRSVPKVVTEEAVAESEKETANANAGTGAT